MNRLWRLGAVAVLTAALAAISSLGERDRADEGHDLLPRADAARRVPDRLDRRDHQVHGRRRLRGGLARRAEPQRPAAQPGRRRAEPRAVRRHPRRGRLRRDQARHREAARRRHPGDDLRPPDHLDAERPHLGRRHRRDRPYRRRRGGAAADREARLGQGQGAADPRRPGRSLHPRHPEGLRGEDGGPPGRHHHHPGRDAVGGHERRQHRAGPAADQPRHRPDLQPRGAPLRRRGRRARGRRARSPARS